jgi:hypothetical protein
MDNENLLSGSAIGNGLRDKEGEKKKKSCQITFLSASVVF